MTKSKEFEVQRTCNHITSCCDPARSHKLNRFGLGQFFGGKSLRNKLLSGAAEISAGDLKSDSICSKSGVTGFCWKC